MSCDLAPLNVVSMLSFHVLIQLHDCVYVYIYCVYIYICVYISTHKCVLFYMSYDSLDNCTVLSSITLPSQCIV